MEKFRRPLLESAVCTGVFAIVFGIVVSCGGGNSVTNDPSGLGTSIVRLFRHGNDPSQVAVPPGANNKAFVAALFQTQGSSGSQLQQSFQATCIIQPDSHLPTNAYIPLTQPDANQIGGVPVVQGGTIDPCSGSFAQIGGGVDQVSGLTLTDPGTPMIFAGTLTTLVATGITKTGTYIRCTDTTSTASVNDGDKVQVYFAPGAKSLILGIGTRQLPFACNLNVPSGEEVGYLVAQFAKI